MAPEAVAQRRFRRSPRDGPEPTPDIAIQQRLSIVVRKFTTKGEGMAQTSIDADAEESFLARLAAADDLAPTVGSGRAPVPITIDGKSYDGIAEVPAEVLALCSAADYEAMGPAHRSHRSRRLRAAVEDGTFSPAQVEALRAKGVLPSES
jgi:hypothetical protein